MSFMCNLKKKKNRQVSHALDKVPKKSHQHGRVDLKRPERSRQVEGSGI
jgi:hypothetical protein